MPRSPKFIQKDFILENKNLPTKKELKCMRDNTITCKGDKDEESKRIYKNHPILKAVFPRNHDWNWLPHHISYEFWRKLRDASRDSKVKLLEQVPSVDEVYEKLSFYASESDILPVKTEAGWWLFKNNSYSLKKNIVFSDEQVKLLILDDFDEERIYFEKLKNKLKTLNKNKDEAFSRPAIPEAVRIEVWRRDSGQCVKCSSRENLEYDHIIPVSKGGSNTTRNIELLCEACNRSKGANIQ
jgi:hypothetical protein